MDSSPLRLDMLNGPASSANARPQWSPKSGRFRGGKLYWIAFSSRRPYGLQVNDGAPLTTRPQLWLGAVVVGADADAGPELRAGLAAEPERDPGGGPAQSGAHRQPYAAMGAGRGAAAAVIQERVTRWRRLALARPALTPALSPGGPRERVTR